MENESNLEISYPAIYAGTPKSQIEFISGTTDLTKLFSIKKSEIKSDGTEIFDENTLNQPRRFFVTDATVASLPSMQNFISMFDDGKCGRDFLIILGSGEPYKTIDSVLTIVKTAINAEFTRKDIFVGLGGGVICDLTAFAASIFKRGARLQFVPTTLLAMVDASIGGKTGCDFEHYKNMIGSFYPAEKLFYFPQFVTTLSEKQYTSGLAEAFKTALLFDKELIELFKNESQKILSRDSKILDLIIRKCVKAKGEVVQKDFLEKNIRSYLNLGHTFAHALESVAGLGVITHGEAVAWGIGRATELSFKKDYVNQSFRDEIFKILELYGWETQAIPSVVRGGAVGERFLEVMHKDKKNVNSNIRITLQKGWCETCIEETDEKEILSVLK